MMITEDPTAYTQGDVNADAAVTQAPPPANTGPVNSPASNTPVADQFAVGSEKFFNVVKQGLGISENAGRYNTTPNSAGAMGKYQFIPARLQSLGYGNVDQYNFTPALQEKVMGEHLADLLSYGEKHGLITPETSPAQAAGLLWAGHLGGYGGMKDAAAGLTGASDAFGTSTGAYAAKGMKKFLFAQQAAGLGDEATSSDANKGTMMKVMQAGDMSRPTSASEMFSKAFLSTYDSSLNKTLSMQEENLNISVEKAKLDGYDLEKYIGQELQKNQQTRLQTTSPLPLVGYALTPGESRDNYQQAYDAAIARMKQDYPDFKPMFDSALAARQAAGEHINALNEEYEATGQSATIAQKAAGLLGASLGFMSDPVNLASIAASLPFMPAGAGLTAILGRGAVAGASQIPVEAALQPQHQEMGVTGAGVAQGALNVAGVGIGSVVFEGALRGLQNAFKRMFNSGSTGIKEAANGFRTNEAGNPEASMPARTSDMVAHELDTHATTLEKVPMADTPQGRAHAIESIDQANALLMKDKPADIYPENAPTYDRPVATETGEAIDRVLSDLDPAEAKVLKAEQEDWARFQKDSASGTEADAARTPIQPQDGPTMREQIFTSRNAIAETISDGVTNPDYATKVAADFDRVTTTADNVDYSIFKTNEQIGKLQERIARDQAALDNWDQVQNNMDLPEYKRNDVAREHIAKRLEDQKIQLENRTRELTGLNEQKNAVEPTRMVKVEDANGNIIERNLADINTEVNEQRTALSELQNCIKGTTNGE